MSTGRDNFLMPNVPYGHPPSNPSYKSSSSLDPNNYHFKSLPVEGGAPSTNQQQQIIIHEFLNGQHSGTFPNQPQPIVAAPGIGSPSSTINNSSITILTSHQTSNSSPPGPVGNGNIHKQSTMVLDRINICINNHYNESHNNGTANEEEIDPTRIITNEKRASTDLEPDSTTSSLGQLPVTPEKNGPSKFKPQEDVLVEHKDGKFYLGTIIAIGNSQCLVRFNDNTECWSDFRELTKLSSGNEADDSPACVVCKRQAEGNRPDDTVELCENCGRGYHIKCMDGNFERSGYWFCRMCMSPNGKRRDIRYVCSGVISESLDPLTDKSQLPYNIEELIWDVQHLTNREQQYCYCGDDGDWLREMIQCCRCQQWFHGRCIRSLQYPIFLGDRFYFFICSICNHGHEFVRRLEVSWPDLIHLALYNLISRNGRRFYDVSKAIVPYVEDNWKTLQMSDQMTKLSPNARKEIITQTLSNDPVRFKCGGEVKKATTMWTLRVALPPNPPNVLLPAGQVITEHMLTQMSVENRVFRFLPRVALEKSFVNDALSREKMTGVNFCSPLVSEDETPEQLFEENNQEENSSDFDGPAGAGAGGDICDGGILPDRLSNGAIYNNNSTGKSASSNLSDSLFSSNAKDGFHLLFGSGTGSSSKPQSDAGSVASGNRRAFKARLKKTDSEKSFDIYDSSDDSTRNTLDVIIPPPKDFTGKNNPFHQPSAVPSSVVNNGAGTASLSKLNETKDLTKKANSSSSTTTATSSVSHLSSNLVNGEIRVARIVKRRLSARDILNGTKNKRRKFSKSTVIGTTITTIPTPSTTIPGSSLIASLFAQPVDGGSWTGGQLSFNQLLPSSATGTSNSSSTSCSSSGNSTPANCSYPTAATAIPQPNVVALPTFSAATNSSLQQPSASQFASTSHSAPKRNPAHGRRLRQRQERNYAENTRKPPTTTGNSQTPVNSLPGSPVKGAGVVAPTVGAVVAAPSSSTNLQTTLSHYFGAAHRIMSGEKFTIKGKRVSMSGQVQYLIEWEGCAAAPVM
ncbi:polycomb protein Pcl [Uranotaenia lowii]|uniref:polycomb protein Pcl n=1 Tax=Uranotaenia lowii TaxID=190385 RepID=UPI00247A1BE8|nr:polycomb protein Pcl [Uranotaenia lowii]